MKVLIPTMGTRGDIQPYIALAKGLNNAGFNTTIATHPCWGALIRKYHIEFAAIGPDIDIEYEASVIRGSSKNWMLGAIRTMKFMFRIIENSSMEIKELCKGVDLVVASHSQIGAAEAEASGIPYISVTLQPDVIPKKMGQLSLVKSLMNKTLGTIISPFMVGPYNKLRQKQGLKKVKTFDELLSPYLNVIPISPVVYPPSPFWEEKNKVVGYWLADEYENYEPENSLISFLQSGPPPIIIALGAMSFESKEEKYKLDILVNAINNTGMRAIIQGFNKTLEGYSLPGNIISVGSVPHSWLFQQAYAVIHHGGFGTTASVIRAGVPSIVIPHVLDQYFWAQRVYDLRVGPKSISSKDLTVEKLTAVINELKENYKEYKSNVDVLSKNMKAENGITKIVELITEILEKEEKIK
jgi:sterol 3beta-glucosyltransferase